WLGTRRRQRSSSAGRAQKAKPARFVITGGGARARLQHRLPYPRLWSRRLALAPRPLAPCARSPRRAQLRARRRLLCAPARAPASRPPANVSVPLRARVARPLAASPFCLLLLAASGRLARVPRTPAARDPPSAAPA